MNETLETIRNAEEAAAAVKREAVDRAAEIIEKARTEAAAMEAQAAQNRTARRRDAIVRAEEEGQNDFAASSKESKEKAEAYAAKVLKYSDGVILKIVKGITCGNS